MRICLVLSAVNIPLVPLQDFAFALSISGVSVLAELLLLRSRVQGEPAAQPPPAVGPT